MIPHFSFADDGFSRQDMAKMLMSPVDIFNESYKKNTLYINGEATTGPRVVNEYRLLGEPTNAKDLSKALRATNFLFEFSGEQLKSHPEFQKLIETSDGQKKLERLFRMAQDSLKVVTGNPAVTYQDVYTETLKQVNQDRNFRIDENNSVTRKQQTEKRDAEVIRRMQSLDSFANRYMEVVGRVSQLSQFSYDNSTPDKDIRRNLEVLRRMHDDFTPDERKGLRSALKKRKEKCQIMTSEKIMTFETDCPPSEFQPGRQILV